MAILNIIVKYLYGKIIVYITQVIKYLLLTKRGHRVLKHNIKYFIDNIHVMFYWIIG